MNLKDLKADLAEWDAFWEGEEPAPTLTVARRVAALFNDYGRGVTVAKAAQAAGADGSDDPTFLALYRYLFGDAT